MAKRKASAKAQTTPAISHSSSFIAFLCFAVLMLTLYSMQFFDAHAFALAWGPKKTTPVVPIPGAFSNVRSEDIIALPVGSEVLSRTGKVWLTLHSIDDSRCNEPNPEDCGEDGQLSAIGEFEQVDTENRQPFSFVTGDMLQVNGFGETFELIGVSVPMQTIYVRQLGRR